MYEFLTAAFKMLNSFLSAGIAITAFSLLMYAFSFNLRDRVTRSFTLILSCVVIVFVCEALTTVADTPRSLEFWLRLQWVGIIFLPISYLTFSDALLATTGKPSRGRRSLVNTLMGIASLGFLLALPANLLVGRLVLIDAPAPHLQRTWLTWIFAAFYLAADGHLLVQFLESLPANRHAIHSPPDDLPDPRRPGASPRILSLSALRIQPGRPRTAALLVDRDPQQSAGDLPLGLDGLRGRLLWRSLARSGRKTKVVQMADARTGDRLDRVGDHNAPAPVWKPFWLRCFRDDPGSHGCRRFC